MSDDDILVGSIDELIAVAAGDQAMAAALAVRGRAQVRRWVEAGEFVDAIEASRRRGTPIERTSQDEVVSILSDGRRYYLACVLELPPKHIARVNRALGTTPTASRVLWWRRPHGGLGGITIAEAIRAGRVRRCAELASGYAEEHGHAMPASEDVDDD